MAWLIRRSYPISDTHPPAKLISICKETCFMVLDDDVCKGCVGKNLL
ncbi:MAG: hypothetical protein ACTS78_00125 [Arsenophonus sp. NC-WZS1-MAG3]